MAGKIIVEAPPKNTGILKFILMLNGATAAKLKKGEVYECDISQDTYVSMKMVGVPKTEEILAKNGYVTKITFDYNIPMIELSVYSACETPIGGGDTIDIKEAPSAPPIDPSIIYDIKGVRGRYIKIYEDRVIINTKATFSSFITGNVSDGEKTIYFSDVVGVQFKKSGSLIGYLQLETAGNLGNNKKNNFFNENTFTFDTTVISNEEMEKIAEYVKGRVSEYKKNKNAPTVVTQTSSSADELLKFKQLLDAGVISLEEFDAKKKQLLGLS